MVIVLHFLCEGCHELITGDRWFLTDSNIEVAVNKGRVGVFVVGGGGQGYLYNSAGASGYFSYQVVDVIQDHARVHIEIGGGGSGVSDMQSMEMVLFSHQVFSIIRTMVGRPMSM